MVDYFAMTSSAYNDTSAQPQTQPMGAARRDPRRGEKPMMKANHFQFIKSPYCVGEVVSNTTQKKESDLISEIMGIAHLNNLSSNMQPRQIKNEQSLSL